MRTPFDRLAKQVLSPLLEQLGTVLTEAEIVSAALRMDLVFIPEGRRDRATAHDCPRFLARAVEEPLALEYFSDAVRTEDVMRSIEKLVGWDKQSRRSRTARRNRAGRGQPPVPRLWILSAGVPRAALRAFDCRQKPGWPEGTYTLLGHGGLIVLSQLPATPDTLIFRLLAQREIQRQALRELLDLPRGAFGKEAMPAMKAFYGELMANSARTKKEEQFVQNTGTLFEKYERDLMDKGRLEGKLEGRLEGKLEGRLEGKREVLTSQLQQRFGAIPPARQAQLAEAGIDELDVWLARILTAKSLDEVLGEESIVGG